MESAQNGSAPSITAYMDPMCPWTRGVVRFFEEHDLEYDFRNISANRADFEEMVAKTGQYSAPCVEVNGTMLADVGGEEVASWMRGAGLLEEETQAGGKT